MQERQSTDFFRRAAQVLGADVEGTLGLDPEQPKRLELRAQVAQMPGAREKLTAAGVEVVEVSRKELRRRNAEKRRETRKQQACPPRMFVDGGQEKEHRRLERNKRKARTRRRGS